MNFITVSTISVAEVNTTSPTYIVNMRIALLVRELERVSGTKNIDIIVTIYSEEKRFPIETKTYIYARHDKL